MKKLEYLVIHCSDTPEGRNNTAADIMAWHTAQPPIGHGWRKPGYSEVIELDGTLVNINDYNNDGWVQADEVTNGARGYNAVSRHLCYVGGQDKYGKSKDTRTAEQLATMEAYCIAQVLGNPGLQVIGHNDLNPGKPCPCFDVKKWWKEVWANYERKIRSGEDVNLEPLKRKRL